MSGDYDFLTKVNADTKADAQADTQNQYSESVILEFISSEAPDFKIYEFAYDDQGVYYFYGTPYNNPREIVRRLWVPLSHMGYSVQIGYELGEYVLVVSPVTHQKERIWLNLALAGLTVISTMFFGSTMFGAHPFSNPADMFKGLPFTLAIMFVLGSHEMGHYVAARWHGMKTSLPYFIPFPSIVGTMGAVIKHRGPIPSRKALFDVGIAGPIAGLTASVLVTIIGLKLPALTTAAQDAVLLKLSLPVLFTFIVDLVGGIGVGSIMHPVAFAGWVGMLVTMLNLIPAGQLDGGHILRAMLGPKSAYVSAIIPFVLLSMALFIHFIMQQNGAMWLFWGLFITLFAAAGHPEPMEDSNDIGWSRMLLGILVFGAGLMCVTLIPIQI